MSIQTYYVIFILHKIWNIFFNFYLGWRFSSTKRRWRHFAIASVANLVPNAICNLSLAIRRLHADQLVWGHTITVYFTLTNFILVSRKVDILPTVGSYNWAQARWQYCDLQEGPADETWFYVKYEWKISICSTYGQEIASRTNYWSSDVSLNLFFIFAQSA